MEYPPFGTVCKLGEMRMGYIRELSLIGHFKNKDFTKYYLQRPYLMSFSMLYK